MTVQDLILLCGNTDQPTVHDNIRSVRSELQACVVPGSMMWLLELCGFRPAAAAIEHCTVSERYQIDQYRLAWIVYFNIDHV